MAKMGLLLAGILFACLAFDAGPVVRGDRVLDTACQNTFDCQNKFPEKESVCYNGNCRCAKAWDFHYIDGRFKCHVRKCRGYPGGDACENYINYTRCTGKWYGSSGECVCDHHHADDMIIDGKTLCIAKFEPRYGNMSIAPFATDDIGTERGDIPPWMIATGIAVLLFLGLALVFCTLFSRRRRRRHAHGHGQSHGRARDASSAAGSSAAGSSNGGASSNGGGSSNAASTKAGSSAAGSSAAGSSAAGSSNGGSSSRASFNGAFSAGVVPPTVRTSSTKAFKAPNKKKKK